MLPFSHTTSPTLHTDIPTLLPHKLVVGPNIFRPLYKGGRFSFSVDKGAVTVRDDDLSLLVLDVHCVERGTKALNQVVSLEK